MTAGEIRAAVERFYAAIWERREMHMLPILLDEGFRFRGSLGQNKVGHAEFAGYVDFVHAALGDYRCEILDLVVEDDKAFARMRFSGEHRGVFFGFAPSGRHVEWSGAALFTFDAGRIAELWVLGDVQGLLAQLERNADG